MSLRMPSERRHSL